MEILHTLSTVAQCGQYRVDAEEWSQKYGFVLYRFTLWGPNYGGAIVRLHRYTNLAEAMEAIVLRSKIKGGAPLELFAAALEAD